MPHLMRLNLTFPSTRLPSVHRTFGSPNIQPYVLLGSVCWLQFVHIRPCLQSLATASAMPRRSRSSPNVAKWVSTCISLGNESFPVDMFLSFGGVRLQALYFKPAHLLVAAHAHPTTLSHKSASFASVQRNILLQSALRGHPKLSVRMGDGPTEFHKFIQSVRMSALFYGVLLFTLSRHVAIHTIPWLTSSVRNK